jgi:hypothetical protein
MCGDQSPTADPDIVSLLEEAKRGQKYHAPAQALPGVAERVL